MFPTLQRACYLSLNPQKDETLETEKAQYVLPDGSTLNVSPADECGSVLDRVSSPDTNPER